MAAQGSLFSHDKNISDVKYMYHGCHCAMLWLGFLNVASKVADIPPILSLVGPKTETETETETERERERERETIPFCRIDMAHSRRPSKEVVAVYMSLHT